MTASESNAHQSPRPTRNLPVPVSDPVTAQVLTDVIDEYEQMFAQLSPQEQERVRRGPFDQIMSAGRSHAAWARLPQENVDAAIRERIKALKAARIALGMTIAEVAAIVGVGKSVISKFENGYSDPRLSTVLRYATAVGMDVYFSNGLDRQQPAAKVAELTTH